MPEEKSWEQRMSERWRVYEEKKWIRAAGPMPTEAPHCCARWEVDGPHGWRQFLTCNYNHTSGPERCDHKHHESEEWYAAA